MKRADIAKLHEIIKTEVPAQYAGALTDCFAVACYLHSIGHEHAGIKLCRTMLESLGFDRRKGHFREILDSLKGNEKAYADAIQAHSEINELFGGAK